MGSFRTVSSVSLSGLTFMPYDGCLGSAVDVADYLQQVSTYESSGIDRPAALSLEL